MAQLQFSRIPRKMGKFPVAIGLQPRYEELLKKECIKFSLKVDPTSTATNNINTYEKQIHRFDTGTPEEWLMVKEDLEEVFRQRRFTTVTPKIAIIKIVLNGSALEAFNNALNMQEHEDLTQEHLDQALNAVSQQVFPYRALENQKQWMTRMMKKPLEMKMRTFVTRVERINQALQHFPGASEADVLTEKQLLEVLEYSLPTFFRNKFDMEGYIPTEHDKARLIKEGETIERFQELMMDEKKDSKNGKKNQENKRKRGDSGKSNGQNSMGKKNIIVTSMGTIFHITRMIVGQRSLETRRPRRRPM